MIVISDPYSLNLTLRLNKLSYRNEIGLRLKLLTRAFIPSPIFLLLMIESLRKSCSNKWSFFCSKLYSYLFFRFYLQSNKTACDSLLANISMTVKPSTGIVFFFVLTVHFLQMSHFWHNGFLFIFSRI